MALNFVWGGGGVKLGDWGFNIAVVKRVKQCVPTFCEDINFILNLPFSSSQLVIVLSLS